MVEMAYNGYHRSIGVSPYQCMSNSQSNTIASSAKGGLCVDFEDDIDNGDGGNADLPTLRNWRSKLRKSVPCYAATPMNDKLRFSHIFRSEFSQKCRPMFLIHAFAKPGFAALPPAIVKRKLHSRALSNRCGRLIL